VIGLDVLPEQIHQRLPHLRQDLVVAHRESAPKQLATMLCIGVRESGA
jgi:hypothetical protein